MAREQGVFPGQADWPDRVFDRVGVELEAAIVEEAGEPFPVGEPIADVFGQPGAGRDHRQLLLEPRLEGGDDRRGMLPPGGEPQLRRCPANRCLDGIERRDLADRRFGDRRFGVARELDEAPAQVAPAMDEPPRPLRPFQTGQPVIALIGVDLEELSAEALKEAFGMLATASWRIVEQHDRRAWPA